MASADISQLKNHFMNHTHSLFPALLNPVKSRNRWSLGECESLEETPAQENEGQHPQGGQGARARELKKKPIHRYGEEKRLSRWRERVSAPAAALGASVGFHPSSRGSPRAGPAGTAEPEPREMHSPTAAEREALQAAAARPRPPS